MESYNDSVEEAPVTFYHPIILVASTLLVSYSASALDQASESALSQTQTLLNNQQQREQALKANPSASMAGEKVNQITTDSAAQNQIYSISAEIFNDLVREANGDSTKLMLLLEQAQKNPQQFYERLSATHKQRIKNVGDTVSPTQKSH